MELRSLGITALVLTGILFSGTPSACAETAQGYYNSGFRYANQGKFDQAISDCTKAIELNPQYAEAYNCRGAVYERLGNLPQALSDYAKAIAIKPDYAKAYTNRGGIYLMQGNFTQAVVDLTRAIEIDPNVANPYNNRAVAYSNLKEYDLAWRDVHKVEALGMGDRIGPEFLKRLREASGRDK